MKVGAAPTYPTIRFLASGSRRAISEWTKPGVTVRRALTAVKRCSMVVTKRDASCASSFGHVIVHKYVCDHAVGKLNSNGCYRMHRSSGFEVPWLSAHHLVSVLI